MLLRVVGSCCAKFETSQMFNHLQRGATSSNFIGPTILGVVATTNFTFSFKNLRAYARKNYATLEIHLNAYSEALGNR